MKKRILGILLVCCLVVGLLPTAALADETPNVVPHDGKEVDIWSSGWGFLHGNAVIFTDGATEGKTKVYKDNAPYGGEVGPEDELLEFAGLTGSHEEGYDLSTTQIYCVGTADYPGYKEHNGDVYVTMLGGTIQELNGSMFCSFDNFTFTMTGVYLH